MAAAQPNDLLHLSAAALPAAPAGITPQAVPSDPLFTDQWNMTVLGMPGVWDTVTGSSDVVVGTVDSGIMGSRPDLQANVPSGSYTLEAGNDANGNGVLADVGEFYGQTAVMVDSSGDVTGTGLNVQLQ